jgi:hypothetical protein
MKQTKKERKQLRESFRHMSPRDKVDYIFTYYKLPIFTACVVLALLISSVWRALTKKDPVLYVAYINVTAGETLDSALTDGYLQYMELDPKKQEMIVYRNLYITEDASVEDHQFVYASKMKLIGSIDASRLDVVLMDEDAYNQMSQSGFLYTFSDIADKDPEIIDALTPYITENDVILEDNAVEYNLNEAEEYSAVTERRKNAIKVSGFPIFQKAGMSGEVYAGIIANTKRPRQSLSYLHYLLIAE